MLRIEPSLEPEATLLPKDCGICVWVREGEEGKEELLAWHAVPPQEQEMARFVSVFAKADLFRSTGLIKDRSCWLEVQTELSRQNHGMLALKRTLKPSNEIFHRWRNWDMQFTWPVRDNRVRSQASRLCVCLHIAPLAPRASNFPDILFIISLDMY